MSKAFCLVFLASMIALLIMLLSLEVGAQSTVDESASCESSTLDEAVNLIREDLKDVRLIKNDLKDVKNILGSNRQCTSAVDTSSLCEYL